MIIRRGALPLLGIVLLAAISGLSQRAAADYDLGPIESLVRQESVSLIDATVTKVTSEGFAELEIHEVVTGTPAARAMNRGLKVVKYISLSCKGQHPVGDVLKEKKRYLLLLTGDMLFEATTAWQVLHAADGESLAYYGGGAKPKDPQLPLMPSAGLYPLPALKDHFRRVAGEEKPR